MSRAASILTVAACLASALGAGEEKPKRPERPMSLQDAIELALRHNLRLAAEKINPRRAYTVIVEQQAIFDPTAYGELSRAKVKQQSTTGLLGERQQEAKGLLGVAKLFPPGTTLDIHAGAAREWTDFPFSVIDPAYSEEWGLTLSQPLLRGAGVRVNTAGIATARNERRIAQAQLRDVALTILADVSNAYWELVFTIRDRALIQRSLDRALNLQRDVEARVAAGVLGERDPAVAEAKAQVAVHQELIVRAEQAIRDAEDNLKVITDLAADPTLWRAALTPTTEPPTTVPPLDPDKEVETALANRPDYQRTQLLIDNTDILLYVRRNELLPRVDFAATYGHTGLGQSWSGAEHHLGSIDFYNWSLGLTFEYPLGNRAARSRYRRARLERDQARLGLKALERQIHLEVRTAVRAVATAVESRRAAQASVAAEQERLRAQEIRYREARVGTIQDVLDAQAALAEAERRELRALIDLNRAIVAVERLRGTLLESSNVTWEEE